MKPLVFESEIWSLYYFMSAVLAYYHFAHSKHLNSDMPPSIGLSKAQTGWIANIGFLHFSIVHLSSFYFPPVE
jgi:hypothetical protein